MTENGQDVNPQGGGDGSFLVSDEFVDDLPTEVGAQIASGAE